MRLLADANIPKAAVDLLRQRGHDVRWACEGFPRLGDRDLLSMASAEGRVLLTFDKDFGELVFRLGIDARYGVILFRLRLASPSQIAMRIADVLESRDNWAGYYSVVEEDRLRMITRSK